MACCSFIAVVSLILACHFGRATPHGSGQQPILSSFHPWRIHKLQHGGGGGFVAGGGAGGSGAGGSGGGGGRHECVGGEGERAADGAWLVKRLRGGMGSLRSLSRMDAMSPYSRGGERRVLCHSNPLELFSSFILPPPLPSSLLPPPPSSSLLPLHCLTFPPSQKNSDLSIGSNHGQRDSRSGEPSHVHNPGATTTSKSSHPWPESPPDSKQKKPVGGSHPTLKTAMKGKRVRYEPSSDDGEVRTLNPKP